MLIQGFIISTKGNNDYKTFDCEILIPALKIHTHSIDEILQRHKNTDYTHVIFNIDGESIEAPIFIKQIGYRQELFVSIENIVKNHTINSESILMKNDFIKKEFEKLEALKIQEVNT